MGIGLVDGNEEDELVYHPHYVVLPFIWLAASILFYLPKGLWKAYEHDQVHILTREMRLKSPGCTEHSDFIVRATRFIRRGKHNCYALVCVCRLFRYYCAAL